MHVQRRTWVLVSVRKYGNSGIFAKQMINSNAQKVKTLIQKINTELCIERIDFISWIIKEQIFRNIIVGIATSFSIVDGVFQTKKDRSF